MVRLSPSNFSRLFDLTYSDDLFGLHALHDEEGGDPHEAGYLQDAVADILTGEEPCNDAIEALLASQGDRIQVDCLTAKMMRGHGIRPAAACALAIKIGGGIRIQDYHDQKFLAYVDELASASDPSSLTAVRLADDVRWNQPGNIQIPIFPETVMSQIIDRPLTKLISHPLLDPLNLTAKEIYMSPSWPGDRLYYDVHTEYEPQPISLEELMNI